MNSTTRAVIETVLGTYHNLNINPDSFNEAYIRLFEMVIKRSKNILFYLNFVYKRTELFEEEKKIKTMLKNFIEMSIENKRDEYKRMKYDTNQYDEKILQTEQINENMYKYAKKSKVLIDLLIELADENLLTNKDLFYEINSFIIAGTETNALSTGYVLMMLGIYPNIQDKVYSEIMEICGSGDRNITPEDLSQLQYTEMVIKETMRLFPAIPMILRQASGDIKLDEEYTIPSGSGIIIPIFSIHRNPEIWTNYLDFDPERFSFENNSNTIPYSFIPFSAGPRNCIGYRYAMMLMKTLIATFIRKYKVHCSYKSLLDIKLKFEIMLKPIDGTLISLEERAEKMYNR